MKTIIISAILILCAMIAFQLKRSDTQKHSIESGYVFFSNYPWCPDGSKVLSGKRLTGRKLIAGNAYVDTDFYTVCQKD